MNRLMAAGLPPIDRRQSEVAALLANPTFGLPLPADYLVVAYKPALSLEGLAQPMIAVGADRYGAAVGGGIAFQFSDMLGDHMLMTAVQLNTGFSNNFSLKNTAAQAIYFNQAHRWNWGVVAGQVPYLSGGFQTGIDTVQGEPAEIDQMIIFRQTEQSAAGIVAYPFSRAQRVEFQAGLTRMSFDQITQTQVFSLNTGSLLVDDTSETSLTRPLALGTTSAALVYDTSNFGATSPVQGQRYRFEASPAFGSINFTSLLADYRRYFHAGAVLHLRRSRDAVRPLRQRRRGRASVPALRRLPESGARLRRRHVPEQRLHPDTGKPVPAVRSPCRSRMMVGNLEFRFPLLRPFGASKGMYGPLPVEVALFADGGVANRSEKPSFLGGSRDGVASAGVAFRANLMGFAVGELSFARPFQRPGRGWVFQFNVSPGF